MNSEGQPLYRTWVLKVEISTGLWSRSRRVFPSTTQPRSNRWPQGAFLGPLRDSWTLCSAGISSPTISKPPLLYQVWESCLLSEIGAVVLVQPLVWEFLLGCLGSRRSSHSVSVGNWYLTCLSKDSIISPRARLPKVCLKPEQVLKVYEVAEPLMFSLSKSLDLEREWMLWSSIIT